MMLPYALIAKEVGETPLQALERFRATDESLRGVPMTYAGRLDPMASGQLLILIGDECMWREKYDSLDKTYQFEILLGAESDTGDILGLAQEMPGFTARDHDGEKIVASLIGTHHLPYPVFSSRTVDGTPLFEHAHRDAGVERPVREMKVMRAVYRGMREMSGDALLADIQKRLQQLAVPETNDFRIERIVPRWDEALAPHTRFTIISVEADVTSGTYIRSLAPHLGRQLHTRALAYRIHRSAIHLPDA